MGAMNNKVPAAIGAAPGVCPMHRMDGTVGRMERDQALFFPMHKRVITQYLKDDAGVQTLYLFYGDQEITFDEPALFAFGESLARQPRFTAGDATLWGSGYAWPKVQELLEQLVEAGILEYAGNTPAGEAVARYDGARPNPLPPAETRTPRSWLDSDAIARELTGRPLALAHLELVVPIFRIAHMAQDTEGRQVGEANVFPKALRLDVPTTWRACIYPGSRYQDARPMNVTALKTMRAHWPQMMAALLHIRAAYLRRFPQARKGWTVGDVERLSTLVLAIPTYQLMKPRDRVENGALHPVLSCLFRVTDGLRMTTHQMLFVPVAEATLSPDDPTSSAEIYAYAERNHAFASTHGVCAGPQAMIEEFLGVLLDGDAAPWDAVALDAPVQAALADMEPAFDYGLLGLQAHAVVFSLWPMMTRTYEQLFGIASDWTGPASAAVANLQDQLRQKADILKNRTLHATEEWRANREKVYADIYAHCAAGLRQACGADAPPATLSAPIPVLPALPQRIAQALPQDTAPLRKHLQVLIARHLQAGETQQHHTAQLADCLSDFFHPAQAVLGLAMEVQNRINALLERPAADRAFTLADIDVHVLLQGNEARRLPHLLDTLEDLLGVRAQVTPAGIDIQPPPLRHGLDSSPRPPEFAGIGPADTRAPCTTL